MGAADPSDDEISFISGCGRADSEASLYREVMVLHVSLSSTGAYDEICAHVPHRYLTLTFDQAFHDGRCLPRTMFPRSHGTLHRLAVDSSWPAGIVWRAISRAMNPSVLHAQTLPSVNHIAYNRQYAPDFQRRYMAVEVHPIRRHALSAKVARQLVESLTRAAVPGVKISCQADRLLGPVFGAINGLLTIVLLSAIISA